MSRPSIPIELIDAIIDQVSLIPFKNYLTLLAPNYKLGSPTRTSTLSSCALVSRAFVSRCQKHIFNTIDLDRRKPRGMYLSEKREKTNMSRYEPIVAHKPVS